MKQILPIALFLAATLQACSGDTPEQEVPALETALTNLGDIQTYSLADLSEGMEQGRSSSEAIVTAYLARIEQIDKSGPTLNSIIALMPDALDVARQRDAERARGELRGVLHGIPVLIKDNIEVAGPVPTTAGSTALKDNVTNRDAAVIERLKAAGAVILGKTNLSQWANIRSNNSTSGWSSIGGLVKNPHLLSHNSCGSSSGSGAAAAAGLAGGTVGTETDGSVVCPASANGIVGLKPTVGLVSRSHIVPISHTQDTAGPMTRTVRGAAMMMSAMAGSDPADQRTAPADSKREDYVAALDKDGLRGLRIGVLRDQIGDQPGTEKEFLKALEVLKAQGAILVDIADTGVDQDALGEAEFKILMVELKADMNAYLASLPGTVKSRTLADLIAFNLTHADVELEHFGQELFELAERQPGLEDPEYVAARKFALEQAGAKGIDRLLAAHDVALLVAPTLGPAWKSSLVTGDKFAGPSASQLPAVSGYPHLTVPMGSVDGLPVGISFLGPAWSEKLLLRAGYAYEQASQARLVPQYRDE